MKSYNNIYTDIFSAGNITLAWKNARKRKTKKQSVKEFEKETEKNLFLLHQELKNKTYAPQPLITFILRDPKTRKIAKSAFRDRVVHHAIINIIGPIFEKTFINASCANQKRKGTSFALKRFDTYKRKVSKNNTRKCFVLKADIKQYFNSIDHEILLGIIQKRIADKDTIGLIKKILNNAEIGGGRTAARYASW